MGPCLYLLWVVVTQQPVFGFYNLCQTAQSEILSNEECSELYFEPSEKATDLGRVKLELEQKQNSLKITPAAKSWTNTFLRITMNKNTSNHLCSTIPREKISTSNSYCVTFGPKMENETFLLEYSIEQLPEISSRKFLFTIPNFQETPLFLYVDQTDTSKLVLNAQKLPTLHATFYEVKAFKEKRGITNLQDMRLFSGSDDIYYEFFTYNDVGYYFFTVSLINENCTDNVCLRMATPKIFIGRKSTRVVIGIVGASFILPFVLFIFHILTKKYPPEESQFEMKRRVLVAYKSSSKKHNEVVFALVALLKKMGKNYLVVDLTDLSKPTKKFCLDSVFLAQRIVYVAPPKHDLNPICVDKSLSEKEFYGVTFEYCSDRLPLFLTNAKTFKLFEDFAKFAQALNISETYDEALLEDLRNKVEEANVETEQYLSSEHLPKIIVTNSEPQENDSLISSTVVL